jgi:serine/threonine-protein kinase
VQRPRFLERFREEARILEQLRHEAIVGLNETIELYGTIFLVLEFVDGRNVYDWVDQRGLPEVADVRCVVRAVARALQAAHSRGIVHRDVKPRNVMIRTDGVVKLTDFGIASSYGQAASAADAIALTPAYAAPEMFTNGECGPACDFYSLGVMAYELMTGRWPFVGENLQDWKRVHKSVPPPQLRERCPHAPADLEGFVEAALMKDPRARLHSIRPWLMQWEQDLSPCLVSHSRIVRPFASGAKRAERDTRTIISDSQTEPI